VALPFLFSFSTAISVLGGNNMEGEEGEEEDMPLAEPSPSFPPSASGVAAAEAIAASVSAMWLLGKEDDKEEEEARKLNAVYGSCGREGFRIRFVVLVFVGVEPGKDARLPSPYMGGRTTRRPTPDKRASSHCLAPPFHSGVHCVLSKALST